MDEDELSPMRLGGDVDTGVGAAEGAWLYTLNEDSDGAECSTGGIRPETCGIGVGAREGGLERGVSDGLDMGGECPARCGQEENDRRA